MDHGDVDVDDVAGAQFLVVGNAVADHMVDRGADGLREAVVADVGGNGLLLADDELVAEAVQLVGGDPGHDMGLDHVQHVGGQAAGNAHFLLFFRGLDRDGHLGRWRPAVSGHAKALFVREVHGIKRGLFWQTNPRAYSSLAAGCSARDIAAQGIATRPPTRTTKEISYAQRVNATDAGSGRPFRTSDPLLEPQDGPVHLRGTQPDPHHQPREDAAAVRGGDQPTSKGVVADGGTVLFVGTKRSAREAVQKEALRCGMPFVNQRWPGGMLTNFKTIRQSIKRLMELDGPAGNRRAGQARQEGSPAAAPRDGQAREEPGRHQAHGLAARRAVRHRRRPRAHRDRARPRSSASRWSRSSTPTARPKTWTTSIPGNDDAMRAISLYATAIADAVLEGRPPSRRSWWAKTNSSSSTSRAIRAACARLARVGRPRPQAARAPQAGRPLRWPTAAAGLRRVGNHRSRAR